MWNCWPYSAQWDERDDWAIIYRCVIIAHCTETKRRATAQRSAGWLAKLTVSPPSGAHNQLITNVFDAPLDQSSGFVLNTTDTYVVEFLLLTDFAVGFRGSFIELLYLYIYVFLENNWKVLNVVNTHLFWTREGPRIGRSTAGHRSLHRNDVLPYFTKLVSKGHT